MSVQFAAGDKERRKRTARDDFQNDSFGSVSDDDILEGEAAERLMVASDRSGRNEAATTSGDTSTLTEQMRKLTPLRDRRTDDTYSDSRGGGGAPADVPGGLHYNSSVVVGNASSTFIAKIGQPTHGTSSNERKEQRSSVSSSKQTAANRGMARGMPPAVAAAMAAIVGGGGPSAASEQPSGGALFVPHKITEGAEDNFTPLATPSHHHVHSTVPRVGAAPATTAAAAAYTNHVYHSNRSDFSHTHSSRASSSNSSRGNSHKASIYAVAEPYVAAAPRTTTTGTRPISSDIMKGKDGKERPRTTEGMLLDGGRILSPHEEDHIAEGIEMLSMSASAGGGAPKVKKTATENPHEFLILNAASLLEAGSRAGENFDGSVAENSYNTSGESRSPLVPKDLKDGAKVVSLATSKRGSLRSVKDQKKAEEGPTTALFSIDEAKLVASTGKGSAPGTNEEGQKVKNVGDNPKDDQHAQMISHEELKLIFLDITERALAPRSRAHHILYNSAIIANDIFAAKVYDFIHIFFVLFSVTQFVITTMPAHYNPSVEVRSVPFVLECITSGFFTMDFILRVVTMPTLRKLLVPSLLVDFLSFIGFYIELIYYFATPDDTSSGALVFLRILRILRIFRIFKILRSNRGFRLLVEVVIVSKESLVLLAILVMVAIMVFSSVLFSLEQLDSTFDEAGNRWLWANGEVSCYQSIPETFLFMCTTITTVGYGDCTPHNWYGRSWTAIVMFSGMLVLAFPNILIGSNFATVHKKMKKQEAQQQLGKYFRKVRMVVRFIRMWREFRVRGHISLLGGPSPAAAAAITNLNPNLNNGAEGAMKINARGRRMNNFVFRVSDYPDRYLSDWSTKAASGAIDNIRLGQLTLLSLMQRLLECFSGCASIDELTSVYQFLPASMDEDPSTGVGPGLKKFQSSAFPNTKSGVIDPQNDTSSVGDESSELSQASIFEMVLRGAAAQLLSLFVVDRESEKGIVCLTKRGITVLEKFAENESLPCLRGYEEARGIWLATVRHNFFDFLPVIEGYKHWQAVQNFTAKRSEETFLYDHRLATAESSLKNYEQLFAGFLRLKRGSVTASIDGSDLLRVGQQSVIGAHRRQCQCRYCNSKWGLSAPVRPMADYCFQPDEELLTLELEYAQQAVLICKLEKQLAELQRQ